MDLLMRIKIISKHIFTSVISNLLFLAKNKDAMAGKKAEKKKVHEVEGKHQDVLDTILEKEFDRKWHVETTHKHSNAYIEAISGLKDKTFNNRFEAEEAFVDVLIKYRKEAGIPVSDKKEDRHRLYSEVQSILNELNSDGQLKGKIDKYIKEGKAYEIFGMIHSNEEYKTFEGKKNYIVQKSIAHDQDPDDYRGIAKAVGKYTGTFFKPGQLASMGKRDAIVNLVKNLYDSEMSRQVDDVAKERAKKKKGN